MPITAVVMLFFGFAVLYDTYVHKKDRKIAAKVLICLIGILSILYGVVNVMQIIGIIE